MKTFKEQVIEDAKRGRAERKKEELELFQARYNKKKTIEFKPDANMERHVYLPKAFIGLSGMTPAAMAVYPVLCSLADFETDRWFQVSRENIAKLAGLNPLTVDKALETLCKFKLHGELLVDRTMKTEGKRHFYVYRIGFIRKENMEDWHGQFLIFHTYLVDTGVWAQLSLRGKALYLAMRSISDFEPELYAEFEMGELSAGYDVWEIIKEQGYRNRAWDLCRGTLTDLCRLANISSSNISETVKQLERYKLLEPIMPGLMKVYLKPRLRGLPYSSISDETKFDSD